jgi:hypothetical protein
MVFGFGKNPDKIRKKVIGLVEERKAIQSLCNKQKGMAYALGWEKPKNNTSMALNDLKARQKQAKDQASKYEWEIEGLNREIARNAKKYKKLTGQELKI